MLPEAVVRVSCAVSVLWSVDRSCDEAEHSPNVPSAPCMEIFATIVARTPAIRLLRRSKLGLESRASQGIPADLLGSSNLTSKRRSGVKV
jgi:hypothetical protein